MNNYSRKLFALVAVAAVPALLAMHNTVSANTLTSITRRHLALSKAEPGVNDTIAASPKHIKLWFTETVQTAATGVQITDASDKVVSVGPISIDAAAKSPAVAEIKDTLKPGTYKVSWKTMADDGHPSKGTFAFTIGTKSAK